MSRRLDIGVASYRNPEKLRATLESIEAMSTTDWRCWIVHNPSDDDENRQCAGVMVEAERRNPRFVPYGLVENIGYAGAVNKLLAKAETEYIAYLDNDVEILTPGWDETLCSYLDRFHELAAVFPNEGAYQIPRPGYREILWAPGFAWVTSRIAVTDIGLFDTTLGHQEEADWATRAHLAGYKLACAPEVSVRHHATATSDPTAIERINRGVMAWVNKWVAYFGGKHMNYHSPNVVRFEDWSALYLEEYWKLRLPGLNDNPEVVTLDGREYDLLRVPRLKGFYRGRII